jgi:outer membrane protein OmpA-like peptidoglycan-associated protein
MRRLGDICPILIATVMICLGVISQSAAQSTIEPINPWPGPPTRDIANPSTEQIINSLTPRSGVGAATRGVRLSPPSSPAAASATPPAVAGPDLLFASGSAELTPQSLQTLDALGKALTDPALANYRFRVEGHSDTVGTRDFNDKLSERRAAAVADYLADRFHVDRRRLQVVGKGKSDLPVATPDQTPEPRNRRVLIINLGS